MQMELRNSPELAVTFYEKSGRLSQALRVATKFGLEDRVFFIAQRVSWASLAGTCRLLGQLTGSPLFLRAAE